MRTASFFSAAMLGVALTGAQWALAQTLYKLIDKNGKITYSEEKPKNFDGQVIPMNIDPNANTATMPKANFDRSTVEGTQRVQKAERQEGPARRLAMPRIDSKKRRRRCRTRRSNPTAEETDDGRKGGRRRALRRERGLPEEDRAARAGREGCRDELSLAEKGG